MKFDEVEISNFRGIDNAKLEEMQLLNLLVGKNNSGKTSILEAIFLLSGMSNPELLLSINSLRYLKLESDNDFKYVFNNLNLEKMIELKGTVNAIKRSVKITSYEEIQQSIDMRKNDFTSFPSSISDVGFDPVSFNTSLPTEKMRLDNKGKEIDGLKLAFKYNEEDERDAYISLKNATMKLSESYKEELNVKYLNSQTLFINGIIDLSSIVKKKQTKKLVGILQKIEPRLSDIQIVNNAVYCDLGNEEFLPINIMGDGIIRTLAVLSSMYDMKGGVLLLDEIENGLHYSSIKVFWKAVLLLAQELGVQIIATTHSYEALGALVDMKEELDELNETIATIAMYRVEKNDEKTRIIHYTDENFIESLNRNYEVR